MPEAILLAAALAADAAAVTAGLAAAGARGRQLVAVSLVFAGFQSGMASIGAYGGGWLEHVLDAWDHWIAAALLAAMGLKMALGGGAPDNGRAVGVSPVEVLALAFATSLDALAAGLTLPQLELPRWIAVLTIGLVTGLMCGFAAAAGRRFSDHVGDRAERLAGVVLILVAARVLWTPG